MGYAIMGFDHGHVYGQLGKACGLFQGAKPAAHDLWAGGYGVSGRGSLLEGLVVVVVFFTTGEKATLFLDALLIVL